MKTGTIISLIIGAGVIGIGAYYLYKKFFGTWGGEIVLTNPVVQYVWDKDLPAVVILTNAIGCPAIKITNDDTTLLQPYKEWILIGGQVANPIYAYLMATTNPPLPVITPSSPINYSHGTVSGRDIYGVAGWTIENTQAIATKFVQNI